MKSAIAYILITLLAYQMIGGLVANYVNLVTVRSEVKQRLKAGIPEAKLTQIIITAKQQTQITWLKKSKEFIYCGQMYDVVSAKKEHNRTTYQCITDVQEGILFAQLDELVTKDAHSKKRSTSTQKMAEYLVNKESSLEVGCGFYLFTSFSDQNSPLHHVCYDVNSPPPDKLIV